MNDKSFEGFTQILEYIIKYFKLIVLFAAALIVLSGVYRVESHEVAVVLRFGRLVGNTPDEQIRSPGLHFALPFFIDEVIRVPVQTIHEREIVTHYSVGNISRNVEESGYLLTGDNNVVLIRAAVRYQISDAAQYALFSSDVGSTIDGIVSGELTRTVANMDIDSVLTRGRADLAHGISHSTQVILNRMELGVAIISIELTEIVPPAETRAHFEEVRSAAVTKETRIQRARESASTQILGAEATARTFTQIAISYQASRLTDARSQMAEFDGLYDQFIQNPQIIMSGTFRRRVGIVLARSGSVIVVPDGADPPHIILP